MKAQLRLGGLLSMALCMDQAREATPPASPPPPEEGEILIPPRAPLQRFRDVLVQNASLALLSLPSRLSEHREARAPLQGQENMDPFFPDEPLSFGHIGHKAQQVLEWWTWREMPTGGLNQASIPKES